jgi:hypothetical protein
VGPEIKSWPLLGSTPSIALAVDRGGRRLACGLPVSTAKSEIRLFDLSDGDASAGRVVVTGVEGILTDLALDDAVGRVAGCTMTPTNNWRGSRFALDTWLSTRKGSD